MLIILLPILIVTICGGLLIAIGMRRDLAWMKGLGGVILVLALIFAVMALPARLRLEKSFTKLDLLLKAYDDSYKEFTVLNQRLPAASFKEKKDFVETQLIAPIDEGLDEINLRTSNKSVKQSYAPRAALFGLHRAGCEFLLLNFALAAEVEELDGKLRSRSLAPTYVSNAIVSSVLPDLKQGIEKLKSSLPSEGLDEPTKNKIAEQTKFFAAEWTRALSGEIVALETQAVHVSMLADLRRFFQLHGQSNDLTHHEAGTYLSLEFASHIQQTNERWKTMRDYLKSADKKDFAVLQKEVSIYRGIHDLLVSEDRESQINVAFETLTDGWQKRHWSQSQSVAFAEREFHSVLPDKSQRGDEPMQRAVAGQGSTGPRAGAENPNVADNHSEKSGQKSGDKGGEKFGHDLRMKVRGLKMARMHLIERLMNDLKNRHQDLSSEMNEWALISRSPLRNSMTKAVADLQQAANSAPAN